MRREVIRAHYENRVAPQRESYVILDWSSRAAQCTRFEVLLEELRRPQLPAAPGLIQVARPEMIVATQKPDLAADLAAAGRVHASFSLLDVGCGLTDLCSYLAERGWRGRYVGVDITPGILREARRRWPSRPMVLADLFVKQPFKDRSFDVVFASGVFNLKLGNNEEFVCRAIPVLFQLARNCLVLNLLHRRARLKYPLCSYFDPDRFRDAVPAAASSALLRDDYLENDLTLIFWR